MAKKIPLYIPYLDKSDEEAVLDRIREKWIVGDGPKCREFEKEFANYLGVKYALLTTSCTAALDYLIDRLIVDTGGANPVPAPTSINRVWEAAAGRWCAC